MERERSKSIIPRVRVTTWAPAGRSRARTPSHCRPSAGLVKSSKSKVEFTVGTGRLSPSRRDRSVTRSPNSIGAIEDDDSFRYRILRLYTLFSNYLIFSHNISMTDFHTSWLVQLIGIVMVCTARMRKRVFTQHVRFDLQRVRGLDPNHPLDPTGGDPDDARSFLMCTSLPRKITHYHYPQKVNLITLNDRRVERMENASKCPPTHMYRQNLRALHYIRRL